MCSNRQIDETVAQGVSIMVYYYGDVRNPIRREMMIAEVRVVAAWVVEMGIGMDEVERRILQPIAKELIARYGHEVGPRLQAVLVNAFDEAYLLVQSGSIPVSQFANLCGGGQRLAY